MLFVIFQLGADRYALPARDIVEVLPMVGVKALPGAPAGVAGLVDYRGIAVPAIDLSLLATGRPAARRVSTRMLMLRYPHPGGGERVLGVIAEKATETIVKEPEEFRTTDVANRAMPCLGPVVHDVRGLIQRVEVQALLSDELRAALFPDTAEAAP